MNPFLLITMRGARLPLAFLGENNGCKDRYNYIAGIHSFQNLPYKIVSTGPNTCDLEDYANMVYPSRRTSKFINKYKLRR